MSSTSPFILINGDTYFAVDVKNLNHLANTVDADWCFSLFKTSEDGRYLGMEVGENGQILSLRSKHQSGVRLANGGVYFVNPRSILSLDLSLDKPISLEEEIFPYLLLQEKKLFGLAFSQKFIDIGVPEDYQRAAELIS